MPTNTAKSKTYLGRLLRRARLGAEITAQQLADRLDEIAVTGPKGQHRGCSASQVLRWETGESEPRFDTLRAIATVYRVTVGQLVDGVLPQALPDDEPAAESAHP